MGMGMGEALAAAHQQQQEDKMPRRWGLELILLHDEALERNADWLRRTKEERTRDIARGKAMAILCEHLDRYQISCLVKHNYFTVRAESGKLYRIDLGHGRNVKLLGANGKTVAAVFCAHPRNAYEIPDCDSMLVQLLHLKYSEQRFLEIANRHTVDSEVIREAA